MSDEPGGKDQHEICDLSAEIQIAQLLVDYGIDDDDLDDGRKRWTSFGECDIDFESIRKDEFSIDDEVFTEDPTIKLRVTSPFASRCTGNRFFNSRRDAYLSTRDTKEERSSSFRSLGQISAQIARLTGKSRHESEYDFITNAACEQHQQESDVVSGAIHLLRNLHANGGALVAGGIREDYMDIEFEPDNASSMGTEYERTTNASFTTSPNLWSSPRSSRSSWRSSLTSAGSIHTKQDGRSGSPHTPQKMRAEFTLNKQFF